MRQRIMALVVMMSIVFSFVSTDMARAAELTSEKTNYSFVSISDLENMYYTYEQDGMLYSVYESYDTSSSEIYTEIYIEKEEGRELLEKFTTKIETIDEIMYITKYADGKIKERQSVVLSSGMVECNTNTRNVSGTTYNGRVYYDAPTGRYFTGWYYSYSHTGSNWMQYLTYTVIVATLMEIIGIPVLTDVIGAIAQTIIAENISIVYWEKDEYHVNQITYPGMQLYGSFIGQRTYVNFYSDSARRNFIGSEVNEWRNESEWPIGVTIYGA